MHNVEPNSAKRGFLLNQTVAFPRLDLSNLGVVSFMFKILNAFIVSLFLVPATTVIADDRTAILGGFDYLFGSGPEVFRGHKLLSSNLGTEKSIFFMETEKVLPIKTFHFTPISEKLYKIIGSKYFEGPGAAQECTTLKQTLVKHFTEKYPNLDEVFQGTGNTNQTAICKSKMMGVGTIRFCEGNRIEVACGKPAPEKFGVVVRFIEPNLTTTASRERDLLKEDKAKKMDGNL